MKTPKIAQSVITIYDSENKKVIAEVQPGAEYITGHKIYVGPAAEFLSQFTEYSYLIEPVGN